MDTSTERVKIAVDMALNGLPASFRRALLAQNKTAGTVASYMETLRIFYGYLARTGMPVEVEAIRREHIESFVTHLLTAPSERTGKPLSPSTAAKYYKVLHIYFSWLLEEGEIRIHPMLKMKRPQVPEAPPPIPDEASIRALLKACEGKDFYARRDTAIVRLLIDTGIRASELAGITLDNLDMQVNTVTVMGKGRRPRTVPFGRKTAQALDRYLRVRATYPATQRAPDRLWLGRGHGNVLTRSGVQQVLRTRCEQAGIEPIHPHQFRHAMAHEWRSDGGSEDGLMQIAGWRSRTMLHRYGASAASKRAHEEHRRLQLGDKY